MGRIFAQLSRQVDAETFTKPLELETQLNFLNEQICNYNSNFKPSTIRNQVNELLNLLRDLHDPAIDWKQRMGIALVKATPREPTNYRKTLWDVPQLLQHWLQQPKTNTWRSTRDNAILFYLLCSGRRASNAACALMPRLHVRNTAILLTEVAAKGDAARTGRNLLVWKASRQEICPVRIIEEYLDHPTTQRMLRDFSGTLKPLFFTEAGGRISADRVRNIAKQILRASGQTHDQFGRPVHVKFVRHTSYTVATRAGVPIVMIKQMQARKQTDSETAHYLVDGCLRGWTDLMLAINKSIDCSPSNWVTIADAAKEAGEQQATPPATNATIAPQTGEAPPVPLLDQPLIRSGKRQRRPTRRLLL